MIYLFSVIVSIVTAGLETVSYLGFVKNHFFISAYTIYFISIVMILFAGQYSKIIKKISLAISCLISTIYVLLIFLESITYPNYIYTHFHINPLSFKFLIIMLWFHTMIINKSKFAKSLLLAILILLGVDGAGRTLGIMYLGIKDITAAPLATYPEKMTKVYPGFYPAMQAIIKLTPPDSTILIPPQGSPWDKEGNAAFMTYFLYPRTVKNLFEGDTIVDYAHTNYYVLISHGVTSMFNSSNMFEYGWPKIAIKAKQMWKINLDSNTIDTYYRDFNPQTDQWDWGLIEVSYE